MTFPIADWQFWTVTASMLGALWMLVQPFVGGRARIGRPSCADCALAAVPRCPSGNAAGRGGLVLLGKPADRGGRAA